MISEDLQARIRAAARELASAMTATKLDCGYVNCDVVEITTLDVNSERHIVYEIEVVFHRSEEVTIK